MNYQQLCARASQLCKLDGYTETSPLPDFRLLVNRALQIFSWEAEYKSVETTVTSVANQSEYTLPNPPDWKRVTDVVYGTTNALDATDEVSLRRQSPTWFRDTAGTPCCWFVTSPNTIRLWPKPSNSGDTVYLRGIVTDTALSADTDSPDVPEAYHDAIAYLAAALHLDGYASGEGVSRAAAYRKKAMDIAASCKVFLAQQGASAFDRVVPRRRPDLTYLGGNW